MLRPSLSRSHLLALAVIVTMITTPAAAAAATVAYLKLNTANGASATTSLNATLASAVLSVANSGSGAALRGVTKSTTGPAIAAENLFGGPALSMRVNAGRPPFTVDSTGRVRNLNADLLDGLNASAFARANQPPWRRVGALGQPAFAPCHTDGAKVTYWRNTTHPEFERAMPTSFYMDTLGIVHIDGLPQCLWFEGEWSRGHTQPVIFTLPAGYRPQFTVYRNTWSDGGPLGRISVDPEGHVRVEEGDAKLWIDVGISFRSDAVLPAQSP